MTGSRFFHRIVSCHDKLGIGSLELKDGGKRRQVSNTLAVLTLRDKDKLGLSAAEIAQQVGMNTSQVSTKAIEKAGQSDRYKYHK